MHVIIHGKWQHRNVESNCNGNMQVTRRCRWITVSSIKSYKYNYRPTTDHPSINHDDGEESQAVRDLSRLHRCFHSPSRELSLAGQAEGAGREEEEVCGLKPN